MALNPVTPVDPASLRPRAAFVVGGGNLGGFVDPGAAMSVQAGVPGRSPASPTPADAVAGS